MYLIVSYTVIICIYALTIGSLIEGRQRHYHFFAVILWSVILLFAFFFPTVDKYKAIAGYATMWFALYDIVLNMVRGKWDDLLYFGENSMYDRFFKKMNSFLVITLKLISLVVGIYFSWNAINQMPVL